MIADTIRLLRLATMLGDAADEVAQHDLNDAADLRWASAFFRGMAVADAPPAKAPHLSARKQRALARDWFLKRREMYAGRTPPSLNADYRDAAIEIPGVSQRVVKSERPPEWMVKYKPLHC